MVSFILLAPLAAAIIAGFGWRIIGEVAAQAITTGVLFIIWAAAITGLTLKVIYYSNFPYSFGVGIYLALGWVGAASGAVLWYRFGMRFITPLLAGGIFYTIGAIMEYMLWYPVIPRVVEAHELFHVMVLLGAGCHWSFICQVAKMDMPRTSANHGPIICEMAQSRT